MDNRWTLKIKDNETGEEICIETRIVIGIAVEGDHIYRFSKYNDSCNRVLQAIKNLGELVIEEYDEAKRSDFDGNKEET